MGATVVRNGSPLIGKSSCKALDDITDSGFRVKTLAGGFSLYIGLQNNTVQSLYSPYTTFFIVP